MRSSGCAIAECASSESAVLAEAKQGIRSQRQRFANILPEVLPKLLRSAIAAPRAMARRIAAHWTRLALADAPSARSSHKISAIGGRGYLFGGEAVARQSIDSTVHCLDPTAGTWTRPAAAYGGGAPAAAPQPRVGHAQAAVSGKLLVFGGRTGEEMGEAALDDLWQWDPVSALWEPLDAAGGGAPPSPRSYHAATAIGESLYVFGGCGAEGRLADLHHFDASSRRWEELPPPPADVAGRGGATLEPAPKGDALWLVAGFAGHETNDLLRFCTKVRVRVRVRARVRVRVRVRVRAS